MQRQGPDRATYLRPLAMAATLLLGAATGSTALAQAGPVTGGLFSKDRIPHLGIATYYDLSVRALRPSDSVANYKWETSDAGGLVSLANYAGSLGPSPIRIMTGKTPGQYELRAYTKPNGKLVYRQRYQVDFFSTDIKKANAWRKACDGIDDVLPQTWTCSFAAEENPLIGIVPAREDVEVAIVFVETSDPKTQISTQTTVTGASEYKELVERFDKAMAQVADYYRTVSNHSQTRQGYNIVNTEFYGPIQVDGDWSEYVVGALGALNLGKVGILGAQWQQWATANHRDIASHKFRHVIYVTKGKPAWASASLRYYGDPAPPCRQGSSLGNILMPADWPNYRLVGTLAHEIGHNLNWIDHYLWDAHGNNKWNTAQGWDLMDQPVFSPAPTMLNRMYSGWIDPEEVTLVDLSRYGYTGFRRKFSMPPALVAGKHPNRLVQVCLAPGRNYLFEYRKNSPFSGQEVDWLLPLSHTVLGLDTIDMRFLDQVRKNYGLDKRPPVLFLKEDRLPGVCRSIPHSNSPSWSGSLNACMNHTDCRCYGVSCPRTGACPGPCYNGERCDLGDVISTGRLRTTAVNSNSTGYRHDREPILSRTGKTDTYYEPNTSSLGNINFKAQVRTMNDTRAELEISFNDDLIPDPSIQPWPSKHGRYVSPDIRIRNKLDGTIRANTAFSGAKNYVFADIHNTGTGVAHNVRVHFEVLDKNVGADLAGEDIGYTLIPKLAAGDTVEVRAPKPWIPKIENHAKNHFCVRVWIEPYVTPGTQIREVTKRNNMAQSNFDVIFSREGSPYSREEYDITVNNPLDYPAYIVPNLSSNNPLFVLYSSERVLYLKPGEVSSFKAGIEYIGEQLTSSEENFEFVHEYKNKPARIEINSVAYPEAPQGSDGVHLDSGIPLGGSTYVALRSRAVVCDDPRLRARDDAVHVSGRVHFKNNDGSEKSKVIIIARDQSGYTDEFVVSTDVEGEFGVDLPANKYVDVYYYSVPTNDQADCYGKVTKL